MGISTKLMVQDHEAHLARCWPGINVPQHGVLRILQHHPLTIKELSERIMLAPSTLVPIIDRLESEGLVVRGRDPDDRRRQPLALTDQARQMLDSLPRVDLWEGLSLALQSLGLERSRQLSQLLQSLVTELSHNPQIAQRVLAMSTQAAEERDTCSMHRPPHGPSHGVTNPPLKL
ncbi:MAG: MarR family transcriptional regulator [Chloroflexi bacterium]|nr:MarR family transcriptional regulator [Chloroflexota bacterium]